MKYYIGMGILAILLFSGCLGEKVYKKGDLTLYNLIIYEKDVKTLANGKYVIGTDEILIKNGLMTQVTVQEGPKTKNILMFENRILIGMEGDSGFLRKIDNGKWKMKIIQEDGTMVAILSSQLYVEELDTSIFNQKGKCTDINQELVCKDINGTNLSGKFLAFNMQMKTVLPMLINNLYNNNLKSFFHN